MSRAGSEAEGVAAARGRPRRGRAISSPIGLALALALALVVGSAGAATAGEESPRTREILVRRCGSELADREVTLFGNGTVRLRRRAGEASRLLLAELEPDELAAFERRLAAIDLTEAAPVRGGAGGELLNQCELALARDSGEELRFRYRGLDAIHLALSHVAVIADELERIAEERDSAGGLPHDYVPEAGDVLVRHDGARFEVRGWTRDGRGVELQGVDLPLTLYYAAVDLRGVFTRLDDGKEVP